MKLTAQQFACGYVEHYFGELRTVTLSRPCPAGDYVVTVVTGVSNRLVRRANFMTLTPARRFAKAMLRDLTIPSLLGVDTL